ncbi:MAG: hypothetical protein ACKO96_35305, partial [Flammeovirgaceae bacterium]
SANRAHTNPASTHLQIPCGERFRYSTQILSKYLNQGRQMSGSAGCVYPMGGKLWMHRRN